MAEMVRKQIYLERRLDRLVKERAERWGLSQAEVIRDALKKAFHLGGERPELEAWRELKRFFDERSTLASKRRGRRWKRDDLYEERTARRRDG
ncbi:MAG: ribbon-helix-helix protein, CopG family [Candidatus Sumerlaeota bacterium]|nr:ribbon-helix-helix protein, CopG family [Candidatus Sumerlaeota bacterium]